MIYYGNNFTQEHCDALAETRISPKILKNDAKSRRRCWFDYRHFHPTQATYLYAHHFMVGVRDYLAKYYDSEKAVLYTPFSDAFMDVYAPLVDTGYRAYKSGQLTKEQYWRIKDKYRDAMLGSSAEQLWKGRQMADSLCMPYNIFIRESVEFLMRPYYGVEVVKHNFMPRPKHFYSTKLKDAVLAKWVEQNIAGRIVVPLVAQIFHPLHSDTMREEIQQWICDIIDLRTSKHVALSEFVYKNNIINENFATRYFGHETLEQARHFYFN